jgi:hypothetical protein
MLFTQNEQRTKNFLGASYHHMGSAQRCNCREFASSPNMEGNKKDEPNCNDKVPVPRCSFETEMALRREMIRQDTESAHGQHERAHDNVQRINAHNDEI